MVRALTRHWKNRRSVPPLVRRGTPRDGGTGELLFHHVTIDKGASRTGHWGAAMIQWAPPVGVWTTEAAQ
jgi:hypothetical protein